MLKQDYLLINYAQCIKQNIIDIVGVIILWIEWDWKCKHLRWEFVCASCYCAFAEDWSLQLKWCSPRNESHSVRMCYLAGLLLTWPRVAVNQRLFCTWSWSSSCWRFNSWGEYLRLKARIFSSGITAAPSQPQVGEYRMWLSVGLLWAWPHCRWSHWGGEP